MQIVKQEVTLKNDCSQIIIEGNQPLISLEIDKTKTTFLFDTGATMSLLTDSTVVTNFAQKDFGSRSAKGAGGKKVKIKTLVTELNSNNFESHNKALLYMDMPQTKCERKIKRNHTGILGMDVFFKNDLPAQFDFTNNKLCNLTTEQFKSLISNPEYFQVKSECKNSKIFIYLTIEGKEYKFKMDTEVL